MNLLVGIPAFNEATTIARVIAQIPRGIQSVASVSVVVADDGSSDGTAELAREAGAAVVRHPTNYGVGAAFHSIVRYALEIRADVLVTIDGDGQFNPADIPKLITPIVDQEALVCTASRFLDPALVPAMPWVKKWGNRRVAGLVSMMTGQRYADVSCGFRAYSREALLRLTTFHSFTYTHETFLDLAGKRISFKEVPLAIRGVREHGKSKVAASVLKYAWRTALIMLRTYRDHWPLRLGASIAVPSFFLGLGMLVWSYMSLQATGSWLKWAAFTGATAIGVAVTTMVLGFMADMATRVRQNQEEILYWLRRGTGGGS